MVDKITQRRMAENEVVFRRYNERIETSFASLKKIALEDDQESMIKITDEPIQFYCECSDENCTQRVLIRPSNYTAIHKSRNQFVIVCGHDAPAIEQVVSSGEDFCVVEKFVTPDSSADELKHTPFNNN